MSALSENKDITNRTKIHRMTQDCAYCEESDENFTQNFKKISDMKLASLTNFYMQVRFFATAVYFMFYAIFANG